MKVIRHGKHVSVDIEPQDITTLMVAKALSELVSLFRLTDKELNETTYLKEIVKLCGGIRNGLDK